MPSKVIFWALRIGWLAVSVVLLLFGLDVATEPENSHNLHGMGMFVFHKGMTLVTFPLGWIAWYVVFGIIVLLRRVWPALDAPVISLWSFWVVLVVVGYLRWFKLIPYFASQVFRRADQVHISTRP